MSYYLNYNMQPIVDDYINHLHQQEEYLVRNLLPEEVCDLLPQAILEQGYTGEVIIRYIDGWECKQFNLYHNGELIGCDVLKRKVGGYCGY